MPFVIFGLFLIFKVAVIAGNLELAEVIKNYKSEEVGEFEPFIMHGCGCRFIYYKIIFYRMDYAFIFIICAKSGYNFYEINSLFIMNLI